uniref:acetyl-CoA carboxylase carboxyltransferase beta subunit n=1 Tax=Batis maritima TaxID=4436 RepID=UPI0030030BEE|nr:TPA_asm: acetyl-CoA carboxylase carboxyltransferase beta subunit [Batis maritima]
MRKSRFNLNFTSSKGEFKSRWGLNDSFGLVENSEDQVLNDPENNIHAWYKHSNYYSKVEQLVGAKDIHNFISDDTFLVRDTNRNSYSIYFAIENQRFEIDNDYSFLSELENFFSSYYNFNYLTKNNRSKNHDDLHSNSYINDTKYGWNNHINSCIDSYFHSHVSIDNSILNLSNNPNRTPFQNDSDLIRKGSSKNLERYNHLWIQCENCYALIYKKIFRFKMNICEQCGYYLKMSSSDRIEFSIDPGTWTPMDEDMVSMDPIEFDSQEEPYQKRLDSYQDQTGLTDAVQTGTGQLNGIPVALGVMDFHFMGGSMGSVVGEKITRLIEYATTHFLPLILVCASGGARMQEGSLSLMQMAKISSVLYDYQSSKKLFYVSILTSPTTGGVTASFGMLGDIIIAEPNAYIAFAGKRVIEQTLNKAVPEGSQAAEYLFKNGLLDLIVPRTLLKSVLSELFQLHAFFPLNKKSI